MAIHGRCFMLGFVASRHSMGDSLHMRMTTGSKLCGGDAKEHRYHRESPIRSIFSFPYFFW